MIHLPSGLSDFKQLRENRDLLYVDKTYFIKEWWYSSYDKVTLITRPRFFGKTLNLSMIDYFFSIQYNNLQYLFNDLFISYERPIMDHQGQIPVIFLNFGDIKSNNPDSIKRQIKMKIWQAYVVYKKAMLDSPNLDSTEKRFINSINHEIDDDVAIHSIQTLCCFLYKVFEGKDTIVLLDEYDSIMVNNLSFTESNEIFNELREFFIAFITSTFKDNKYLLRGLITGILNVSLFSDFNGANNIKVYTIMSNKYLNSFGFTSDELFKLTELFQLTDNLDEIEKWYDGYNFGYKVNIQIYNPWSISQFFNQPYRFATFWFNTSSNEFIKEFLIKGPLSIKDDFIKLIQGKSVKKKLTSDIILNVHFSIENHRSVETFYNLLLSSGYLTIKKEKEEESEKDDCNKKFIYLNSYLAYPLKMPNLEIINSFDELINEMFDSLGFFIKEFIDSFLTENTLKMESFLLNFLSDSFQFFDPSVTHPEVVYRAFILGLTVHIKNSFYVKLFQKNYDDQNFYVLLKPLNDDDDDDDDDNQQSSFVFAFRKQSSQNMDEDLSISARSIIDHLDKTWFNDEIEKRGIELHQLKKFGLAFNDRELKIHFNDLSKSSQSKEEEEDTKEDQIHPESEHTEQQEQEQHPIQQEQEQQQQQQQDIDNNNDNDNNNNNNNNEDDDDDENDGLDDDAEYNGRYNDLKRFFLTPKFDHKNKSKIHENDEVFVIDQNGVDIWDAVVLQREMRKNVYHIHYPDFPEDDEKIKGVTRLLVKSKKNVEIFRKQEEVRRKKELEEEEMNEGEIGNRDANSGGGGGDLDGVVVGNGDDVSGSRGNVEVDDEKKEI